MTLPKEEAIALREHARIIARVRGSSYSVVDRRTAAATVEDKISEGKGRIIAYRLDEVAALFYPNDPTRAGAMHETLRQAMAAKELVSGVHGGVLLTDLAIWQGCPPIPVNSPLRNWLPVSMHAAERMEDGVGPQPIDSTQARQDARLARFRAMGGTPPRFADDRWHGTTTVAKELKITRQSLTEDLKAALKREQERQRVGPLDPSRLG